MLRYVGSFAITLIFSVSAFAAPIVYKQSPIAPGGTIADVNTQVAGSQTTTLGATYHNFYANAGSLVTVFGDRQAGHYDMSLGIWKGTYGDTTDLAFFDANFIAFADDEDPPNIAGPFGDPRSVFVAPVSGFYTIAVTNFLSSAGPPNPYTLTVQGNANAPEPTSIALFGLTALGGAFYGWRRRQQRATV
jgi:hypothetical protein